MKKSAPNRVAAPILIAGVTIGFLASAYHLVFANRQKNQQQMLNTAQQAEQQTADVPHQADAHKTIEK